MFINSCCGERKLTYHEPDFDPIFLNYGTYRTQIRLNFMEVLYFKIDHTNNYLKNVSFPIEYNNKSFLKF